MNKLLKKYGFWNDMQYFEMIAESFINGQVSQGRTQFSKMQKLYRQEFLKSAIWGWESGITTSQLRGLIDLI